MAEKLSPDTKIVLKQIGEHLRAMRKAQGISRAQIATRLDMHLSNYAKLERGVQNLTVDTLLRLAQALDTNLLVEFQAKEPRKASD